MITSVLWVKGEAELRRGGIEQIATWQQLPEAQLWLHMWGEDPEFERAQLERFAFHPLAIKDGLKNREPPKYRVYDDYTFVLLRGLDAESLSLDVGTIQLAFFCAERCLVTRSSGDSPSINHWLHSPELTEHLAHGSMAVCLRVASTVAQRYLNLLLDFEPRLGDLEDNLLLAPSDDAMTQLIEYRTSLRKLWRIFSYQEKLFQHLCDDIPEDTAADAWIRARLTEVYDKFERLHSLSQLYYSLAGDLIEGYLSLSSHALNKKLGVLTVMTAIFVPLSFLAGVYGMNFDVMPELHYRWGYFVLLSVMLSVAVGLIIIFRRKKWL